MKCPFDLYDYKICFMKSILRSNDQNYSLALEKLDGDDINGMQVRLNES